jgi:hypothetical protein
MIRAWRYVSILPIESPPADMAFTGCQRGPRLATYHYTGRSTLTRSPGPASYLSICSEPAVDWVSRHIGVPDFRTLARRLTTDVMRSEKLERTVQSERAPEPDMRTAWKWTAGRLLTVLQGQKLTLGCSIFRSGTGCGFRLYQSPCVRASASRPVRRYAIRTRPGSCLVRVTKYRLCVGLSDHIVRRCLPICFPRRPHPGLAVL